MNNNVRKLFTLDTRSRGFSCLDEKGKILVEAGFNVVKTFAINKAKVQKRADFVSLMNSETVVDNYSETNRKFMEKLVKYSMEKAGLDTANFDISNVANSGAVRYSAFKENFNAVIAQVLSPVVPAMVSAEFMDLADVVNIGNGDTARFVVHSNDTFYVNRMAEGIQKGSIQRIYNDEMTVNPEPYNIAIGVDWYQIASGVFDFGEWAYKVGYAFNEFISTMIINAITDYVATGIAANPASPYFTNGLTDAKFAKISELVKTANRGAGVSCYGPLNALAAVLPGTTRANLMADLGQEWSKVGYLTNYLDTRLVRVPQIMLPNTVNTTALLGVPNDTLFFFADGGYRPVKVAFEGQAITVDTIPTASPDKEMGMNITMRIGQGFVAASKFGAITGVTL